MSGGRFGIVPAHAIDDTRISSAALRVLLALGTYGPKDGWCFPSMNEIARRLGVSRQAVQKQVRVLEHLGYIESRSRSRPDGSQSSNDYRLIFDRELPGLFDLEADVNTPQPQVAGGQPTVAHPQPLEVAPPATSGSCTLSGQVQSSKEKNTSARAARRPLPIDFSISEPVKAWAEKHGYAPYLQAHFEFFGDWARGGGNQRSDWDATLRNCIRADWGGIRKSLIASGKGISKGADTSCRADVAGQRCGMPGHPDPVLVYACSGHQQKRLERSGPVPDSVREKLGLKRERA